MTLNRKAMGACVFVVFLGVSLSGCVTVFPAKTLLTTDPRAAGLVFENFPAYDNKQPTDTGNNCPDSGSEQRPIFVPERSQRVTLIVRAHLTNAPSGIESFDTRHFDLTIADGAGLQWVDVHLKNNDTVRTVLIDGPRPGVWSLTLSWQICTFNPANVHDSFEVQMVVRQPA